MKLQNIFCYPLKGARGITLENTCIDYLGVRGDRRWMIVDKTNRFISQRTHPMLALIEPSLGKEDGIRLNAPGMEELYISPLNSSPERVSVEIWSDICSAVSVSRRADEWFSTYLNDDVQLVYMDRECRRRVDPDYGNAEDLVSFADGYPILIISDASLKDLNARLSDPVPMNRFRPNLVISGAEPFEEDSWTQIKIEEITLSIVKSCARCQVITIDQNTGKASKEPLRTLSTYRKVGGKVHFGQNAIPRTNGTIRVGAEISVL